MARIEKTVFISYRRTNFPWGLAIFQDLTHHGYDVFFDYSGIASGDFETVILENIRARAHFLVLLTPSALERCGEPGDWLRREIETALESRRNIVPLMLEGFDFGTPAIASRLTGKLAVLKQYNAMSVFPEYFDAAMTKLRDKFLNVPLDAVLHPASRSAVLAAREEKGAAVMAPAVAQEELTAQQWFERGRDAYFEGDLQSALQAYDEAIRLQPEFCDAWVDRGTTRLAEGDLEGALEDYNQAIRLKPKYAYAFNDRGSVLYDKGDLEGALEDYDQAILLKPDDAEAFFNRGNARYDKGDLNRALEDYNEAIRLKPDNANAFYNRGVARYRNSDLQGALQDFNQAIRLKPDYTDALKGRDIARKAIAKAKGKSKAGRSKI